VRFQGFPFQFKKAARSIKIASASSFFNLFLQHKVLDYISNCITCDDIDRKMK
jgi:hypothetical protein